MFTSLTSLSASASTRCTKVGPSIQMLHGKSLAWNSRVARSAVLQSVTTCFHWLGLETSTIIADVPQYYATICVEVKSIFVKSSCSLIVSTRSIAMTAAQSSSRGILCPCVGSTFPFSRRNPTSCLSVSEKTLTHASADIASLHVCEENIVLRCRWIGNGEHPKHPRNPDEFKLLKWVDSPLPWFNVLWLLDTRNTQFYVPIKTKTFLNGQSVLSDM